MPPETTPPANITTRQVNDYLRKNGSISFAAAKAKLEAEAAAAASATPPVEPAAEKPAKKK
jgi:hypothetical protein